MSEGTHIEGPLFIGGDRALTDADDVFIGDPGTGDDIPANWFTYAAWGDSLTDGATFVNYPTQLYALVGQPVYNGGVSGETSEQIRDRFLAETATKNGVNLIWVGHNDIAQSAKILPAIQAMVAGLTHTRFLILSVITDQNQRSGTAGYNVVAAVNASIAAAFPSNYVDVRAALVAAYDPGDPTDVTDHAGDTVPQSLRKTADILHLNTAGYAVVAATVAAWLAAHDLAMGRRIARLLDVLRMFEHTPGMLDARFGDAHLSPDPTQFGIPHAVAIRNGLTPQALTIYAKAVPGGATEWVYLGWLGTPAVFTIANIATGGGANRDMRWRTSGNGRLLMGVGAHDYWTLESGGHWRPLGNGGKVNSAVVPILDHAPTDADFDSPIDGLQAVDSVGLKHYTRVGGAWKYAALT